MGSSPRTKATCLKEIESLTHEIDAQLRAVSYHQGLVERAKVSGNKLSLRDNKIEISQRKSRIAQCKAKISALKAEMKTLK